MCSTLSHNRHDPIEVDLFSDVRVSGPKQKIAGRWMTGTIPSAGEKHRDRGAIACLRLRHDHRVNDVDDAICSLNVSLHDLGVIDLHAAGRIDVN